MIIVIDPYRVLYTTISEIKCMYFILLESCAAQLHMDLMSIDKLSSVTLYQFSIFNTTGYRRVYLTISTDSGTFPLL